jgi:hypothetical protein
MYFHKHSPGNRLYLRPKEVDGVQGLLLCFAAPGTGERQTRLSDGICPGKLFPNHVHFFFRPFPEIFSDVAQLQEAQHALHCFARLGCLGQIATAGQTKRTPIYHHGLLWLGILRKGNQERSGIHFELHFFCTVFACGPGA